MKVQFIPIFSVFLIIWCIGCSVSDKTPMAQPRTIVYDSAAILTPGQADSISVIARELEPETGSQVAVVIIPDLAGRSIEEYSYRTATGMQLGRAGFEDGILITLVMNEKKVRIEVGNGLENIIKDEIAQQIIRKDMVPSFRKGEYDLGLYKGVRRIRELLLNNKSMIGVLPLGEDSVESNLN